MDTCEIVQCQRLNIIAGKVVCGVNTKHAIKDCPPGFDYVNILKAKAELLDFLMSDYMEIK